jgi:hypothetical protein
MRSRATANTAIAGSRAATSTLWLLLVVGTTSTAACRVKEPTLSAPFTDTFERAELGPDWRDTGGGYQLKDGRLVARGAHNHPAWLRKRLPRDIALEFDAQSNSPTGDIKVELFGDGESFDADRGAYVSTGYMLIFGGWQNSLSVICRNNEHDEGRKVSRTEPKVEVGRRYHLAVTRKDGRIDWKIDGAPFLSWTDPAPLAGAGHEYLAVNDWESEVLFDNFTVAPAP